MRKEHTNKYNLLPKFLTTIIFLISSFCATAQTPGTQLAYFIGFHSYYGAYPYRAAYVYPEQRYYPPRTYWTGWSYLSNGCRRNCTIDRRYNRATYCIRRC